MTRKVIWKISEKPKEAVLKKLGGLPLPVKTALINRGITSRSHAKQFFNPSEKSFHDPFLLADMEKAVQAIESAIKKKERIGIHGDFDVDGVCSTAILTDYLVRKRGAQVTPYIPNRVDEGYGLSKESLDALAKKGVNLLITVDCGINSGKLVKYAKKKGMKVLVTDHHTIGKAGPSKEAEAVIHPDHPKGKYPFSDLAGAGVAWKIVSALENSPAEEYLELAALATVCDVMPLIEENRAIVKLGLEQMNKTERIGLKALINQAGLGQKALDAYHLGFVLGPRINASGRLASAITALKLLIAQETYIAASLADKLEELNIKRQTLTKSALEEADLQVKAFAKKPLYLVHSPEWNEGIVGLVAGKLTEKYHRPSIAVTVSENEARGSARSIKGYNIVEALAAFSEHLNRYGGHAQAAGFSLNPADLNKFKTAIVRHAEESLTEAQLIDILKIDAEIEPKKANLKLSGYLERFKPTGFGNPTPVFKMGPLSILNTNTVGRDNSHIKLFLKDEETNRTFDAIWFSAPEKAFQLEQGNRVEAAVNIERNTWNSNTRLQLKIKDLKKAS